MTTIRSVAELDGNRLLPVVSAKGKVCRAGDLLRWDMENNPYLDDPGSLPAETLHPRTVGKAEVEKARNSGYVQAVNDNSARITNRGEWFDIGFDAALAAMGIEVTDG